MKDHNITCPACLHAFPLEAAFASRLRGQIDAELRVGYDARWTKERECLVSELTLAAQAEATRANAARFAEMENAAAEHESDLERMYAQLESAHGAEDRARKEFVVEREELEGELARQRTALADLRRHEVELRREKASLEEARHELEVQSARTLDAERVRLREELARKLETERVHIRQELASAHTEAQRLREAEHTQRSDALHRQVEDLRRRLEAGGEQRRGDACEVRLEEVLRAAFPGDTIEAVARGVNGADVRQRVCPPGQRPCGTILYESKHTAHWNSQWTAKLRDDQRAERAELAVLVTAALPKDLATFGLVDGVWVTSVACLPGLALALRLGLLQLASHRQAMIGRGEKMERVYAYLTGDQFKQNIESLVSTFTDMGEDLNKEKRALTTMWHRREKQLERMLGSLTRYYADLQAIAGAGTLPPLAPMELTGLLEDGDRAATVGPQLPAQPQAMLM